MYKICVNELLLHNNEYEDNTYSYYSTILTNMVV